MIIKIKCNANHSKVTAVNIDTNDVITKCQQSNHLRIEVTSLLEK